jgi:hypothetical protein
VQATAKQTISDTPIKVEMPARIFRLCEGCMDARSQTSSAKSKTSFSSLRLRWQSLRLGRPRAGCAQNLTSWAGTRREFWGRALQGRPWADSAGCILVPIRTARARQASAQTRRGALCERSRFVSTLVMFALIRMRIRMIILNPIRIPILIHILILIPNPLDP